MGKPVSTWLLTSLLLAALAFLAAARVDAQESIPGIDNVIAGRQEQIEEKHYRFLRNVELTLGDAQLFADLVEIFTDEDRMVATGNVTLVQTTNRISAERAEFNYKTKLGTFYRALGFATIKPQAPRPGAIAAPPVSSQDTDVYFQGEVVEKIGGRKYKITKGGFTTCVQPTPRWELTSDTIVLNIEHYTFLRNAIFSVKGVPLLYTPIMYYPTKKDDRSTGFLIPTLGETTLRGESIHNAFFWVLDRSEDLTFMHDWFSRTGQGLGSEYRYNFGGQSNGNLRAYLLNQHNATYTQDDGSITTQPAGHPYEIHGNATQFFPGDIRARGRVDYFSNITENQSFNTNYVAAFTNQRSFGGNAIGAWGTYSMNATVDHTEYFSSATNSVTSGNWPKIAFNRNERLIPGTPLYFSVGSEYASLLKNGEETDPRVASSYNQDVTRLDFNPQIRYPFKKWQWFTVNSTLSWRDTYYTRSVAIDPVTAQPTNTTVDNPLNRRFFTLSSQVVGPVFTRIWDTPDNSYAEKFKHSIEPFINVSRTSSIERFDQIIKIDGTDQFVGGNTSYTYGVNNRFYAKQPSAAGQRSQSREIFDVTLQQTYYTQAQASQYDSQYSTSSTTTAATNLGPYQIAVRAMPTNDLNATANFAVDSKYYTLQQVSASGGYSWTGRVQTSLGWSKNVQINSATDKSTTSQAINGQSNVHTRDNRFGGIYSFNYDFLQGVMLQQRVSAFYNSQCCGIAFEYQTFNYGGVTVNLPVPSDHRFFLSFTLAGLGNFSPFNGALSGVPR